MTDGNMDFASWKNGSGFSRKNSMSNIAWGCGKLYFWRLSYNPDPGLRKSGIPAAIKKRGYKKVSQNMSWSKMLTGWNSRANHDNNLLTTTTLDVLNDSIDSDLGKDTFRLILPIITELFTEKLAQFFDCEGNRVRNWRGMICYSQRGSSWSSSSSCSSPLDADDLISSCYEQWSL